MVLRRALRHAKVIGKTFIKELKTQIGDPYANPNKPEPPVILRDVPMAAIKTILTLRKKRKQFKPKQK